MGDIQADYQASKQAGVGFIHAGYGFGTIDDTVPELLTFEELLTLNQKGTIEGAMREL